MLPDMKASCPGRVSWEATPSGRAGEGVALAGPAPKKRGKYKKRIQAEISN